MTSTQNEQIRMQEIDAVLADLDANPWPDDIVEARVLYDRMGPPIADDIAVDKFDIGGQKAQLLTPPEADTDRALLFLHGGGYVYGSLMSHGGMAAEITRAAHCRGLQLDYRLAPEHPYPAAVEDACEAYEWLLGKGFSPPRVALVGDSAGGGLVIAALAALQQQGHPMPGAAVCLSPWVDLEATGDSYETRKQIDPMVERKVVELVSRLYLNGQSPKLPTASPIHADLRNMPPLLIQVGEREILFSDSQMLADKARASGLDVTFEEWPGMVHVWHLYYPILSAGREAIARVGQFIVEKTRPQTSTINVVPAAREI
jgi:epsilon-lactone hydrolase